MSGVLFFNVPLLRKLQYEMLVFIQKTSGFGYAKKA